MAERVFGFLKEFWPIIAVIGLGLIAWGETRFQVQQLVLDKRADIKQWELIRSQGHDIVSHERRLQEVERHITPQAIQRWGQIQNMVEEDHRDLKEHLRTHPR